jgi:predicted flavoprotein YhiN
VKGADVAAMAKLIKAFPLELVAPQPITEAISSSGGIRLEELDERLMLRRLPGCFAAGEMLDWDVPTGGFLIQGSVSSGHAMGRGILAYLSTLS